MSNLFPAVLTLTGEGQIPLWLKISFTLFVVVLVPVYWRQYGPGNFLWFSDIGLLLTVPALWLESALLASIILVSVGLLELTWIFDFLVRLISGVSITGLSAYMFDPKISLTIRAFSLFHVVLPVVVIWMVWRLGYDDRALPAQTVLAWIVLPLSYLLPAVSENVNWVHGFGGVSKRPQRWMSPRLYVALLMLLFPAVVYLPTHLLCKVVFDK